MVIVSVIFIIFLGYQYYENFYLKWIKVAIVYSDPYREDEIKTILSIEKENINKIAVLQIGIFETADLLNQIKNESVLKKIIWIGSDAIPSKLTESYFQNNTRCFNNILYYAPLVAPHYSIEYYNIVKEYEKYVTDELDFIQCARYDAYVLIFI